MGTYKRCFIRCPECGESFTIGTDIFITVLALYCHLYAEEGVSRDEAFALAGSVSVETYDDDFA